MFVSLFKELNLANLPMTLLKKVLFVLLLTTSSIANALTMGDFVVDSFLDKPLKAEIVVNGDSGDNLKTLEVSMASEEEFKQAGILRSSSLDDFNFELIPESKNSTKILVTTDGDVSDPYIHMLLKIRWNGGQLLREFTALIDPPLYSSQPADPVNAAKTQQQKSSQEKEADLRKELKSVDDSNEQTAQTPAASQAESSGSFSRGTYGPVQAGESLSEIAVTIQKDNPDLSIYQIMYVLFQNNQSAFVGNNINGLAKGSTLQVGDLDAIAQVDRQEGINFFYSQLAQWSARQESFANGPADEVKIASDSDSESTSGAGAAQNDETSGSAQATTTTGGGSAEETKPEFQVAASDVQAGAQESGEATNQVVTDLRTQVAELEASVESAKLENEELKETISILESQLADSNRLIELNNQELASLAAENNQENNEPLVSTTVEEEKIEEEPAVTQEAEAPTDAETEPQVAAEDTQEQAEQEQPKVEETVEPVVEEPKAAEQPAPVAAAQPDPFAQAPESFLDSLIAKIKQFWQFLAIALVGILVAVFWKMRSSSKEEDAVDAFESTFTVFPEDTGEISEDKENTSDAKAEELINAIKAETTKPADEVLANVETNEESGDTSVVSSIDMDALREATQSVTDFDVDNTAESGEVTKESSFLTVYNDGDVVVNADEIDPIAEADVYIAYGREDQGEEVLVDGVKNFPDRNDIKIALLGLYVKSGKREKFDEVYKSLVNNGAQDNAEEWQSIEELKSTMDAKTGGGSSVSATTEPLSAETLNLGDEVSNTDFIINSDVNDLSEIDIKSESFEISEIDFSTDIDDAPVLTNAVDDNNDVAADIDNVVQDNEITLEIETDNIDSDTLEIESITIQVEETSEAEGVVEIDDIPLVDEALDAAVVEIDAVEAEQEIDGVDIDLEQDSIDSSTTTFDVEGLTSSLDGMGFAVEENEDNDDVATIEQEISQIDFSDDMLSAESSIQIDIENDQVSQTDAVDISAEISEISYDDEISLTDVMELNVQDVDLAAIPDDKDLTPVVDNSATSLVNDVEFVDDDTVDNEVTVDLTETLEFSDDDEVADFGDIDLDLGAEAESSDASEGELPDGHSDPETQLDLAKVFLELDDVPGAVKILKELVDNAQVGEEAKDLLEKYS